jgi:pyrroloquinoline quinone (PQQ) biosynthesis protein C
MFPFHDHPHWRAVMNRELSLEQILRAEVQHYLRTRAGQALRREAVDKAKAMSPTIFESILQTFLEECTTNNTNVNHLDLILRLVTSAGISKEECEVSIPTPGNSAAIALYRDIASRGAACHILGAGAVEHYYAALSQKIYSVYTEHYGMSAFAAETYRIHGPMDIKHSERALAIVDEAISIHGWDTVNLSVRDAFLATSLHYDGMFQAALGHGEYWDGRSK